MYRLDAILSIMGSSFESCSDGCDLHSSVTACGGYTEPACLAKGSHLRVAGEGDIALVRSSHGLVKSSHELFPVLEIDR